MPPAGYSYSLLPSHSVPNTPAEGWTTHFGSTTSAADARLSAPRLPRRSLRHIVLCFIVAPAVLLLVGLAVFSHEGVAVTAAVVRNGFGSPSAARAQDWLKEHGYWWAGDGTAPRARPSTAAEHATSSSLDRVAKVQGHPTTRLPTCDRTLLYTFAGSHGLASEYLIFLRIAMLARQYGYALFIDDSRWNYGRWTDYFLPIQNDCAAPSDDEMPVSNRTVVGHSPSDPPLSPAAGSLPAHTPLWAASPHVVWSSRRLAYLDALFMSALGVDQAQLHQLHNEDIMQFPPARPLTAEATVPSVFIAAFGQMAAEVRDLWRLNPEMEELVRQSSEKLGWRAGEAHDASERDNDNCAGRIVIAAHVRLGDKSTELAHYGPHVFPEPAISDEPLHSAWAKHAEAAKALLVGTRVRELQLSGNASDPARAAVAGTQASAVQATEAPHAISDEEVDHYMQASWQAVQTANRYNADDAAGALKPVLVIMSDDVSGQGLSKFRAHPLADRFDILLGLDDPHAVDLQRSFRTAERDDSRSTQVGRLHRFMRRAFGSKSRAAKQRQAREREEAARLLLKPGFNEATFNSLGAEERVTQTRLFLRDLTLLAQRADGLVFTGSSNVGRLMSLVAGRSKMEDARLRSTDVRWFPTVRYQ